jgi:hypothetical protein
VPGTRYFIRPGQKCRMFLPSSEVCMHMQVAGKVMTVELVRTTHGNDVYISAQLYKDNGDFFSSRITYGEAGFYHEGDVEAYRRGEGFYFYAPEGVEQPEEYEKAA